MSLHASSNQVQALVQIVRRFGWTYVGLVVDDSDKGIYLARTIRSELERSGTSCLAYVEFMRPSFAVLQRVVTTMKESKARVVIYLASYIIDVLDADNQWAEGVRSMFILGFTSMS